MAELKDEVISNRIPKFCVDSSPINLAEFFFIFFREISCNVDFDKFAYFT